MSPLPFNLPLKKWVVQAAIFLSPPETGGRREEDAMGQVTLTEHAKIRMDSRRIPTEAVDMALLYGREIHVKGATFYAIGRREVERSLQAGVDLKGFEGIQVICAEDDVVVTAYRNRDFSGLRPPRPGRRSRRKRGGPTIPWLRGVAA